MDTNEEKDVELDGTTDVEPDPERTDWKAKAIEWETKYKSEVGSRKRLEKDLKQQQTKTEPSADSKPQDKQESKGFDYGQLAYLEAKGITDPEDQQWLEQTAEESRLELKDLLGRSWVTAELKERKEHRMAEAATPAGSKQSGQAARDSVDYWIAKGELPQDPDLARKVVNERIKRETSKSQFSSQPIVE